MKNKNNSSAGKSVLIALITAYQKILSPYLGEHCRFYPSCSEYALISINKSGALKGTVKSIWRILRCNPLNKGGIDYP